MSDHLRQIDQWIADLKSGATESTGDLVQATAKSLLTTIVDDWPGTDRDVHTYARDKSKRAWDLDAAPDRLSAEISNTANNKDGNYSGYVNEGYNKQGAGQARSYQSRGSKPYVQRSVERVADQVVRRHAKIAFMNRSR